VFREPCSPVIQVCFCGYASQGSQIEARSSNGSRGESAALSENWQLRNLIWSNEGVAAITWQAIIQLVMVRVGIAQHSGL